MKKRTATLVSLCLAVISTALCAGLMRYESPSKRGVGAAPGTPAPRAAVLPETSVQTSPSALPLPPKQREKQFGNDEAARRIAEIGKRAAAPLEARWSQEARDPKWTDFQARLTDFLTDPRLIGIDLVSVDCRTTLCRYELEVDDRQAVHQMLQLADKERAFLGALGLPVLAGERFIMYLAPPGVPFFRASIPQDLARRAENTFGIRIKHAR